MSEVRDRRRGGRAGARRARRSRGPRASPCTPRRWSVRRESARRDAAPPRSPARPGRPTSRSTLGLDGTGAGDARDRRRLPRPHARPARPPRPARPRRRRSPATCRPARTTRSRTPASCSARRSTRRSATARGILRYGHAVVPMDEARAACAIDISGPPVLRVRGRRCRPGATGGFEHELAEEFFRAVASAAQADAAPRLEAGTNAHHMIEACFKAFARALREAVAIDPTETGVPVDEGDADRRDRASSTTGWATAAASRRRSSTSARDAAAHRRPRRAARAPTGWSCPASARSREAMRGLRAAGLDELVARARRAPACRCSASASACSCCSSAPTSTSGADGPRACCPATVARAATRRAEAAAHRLERRDASSAPSPLTEGLGDAAAFYHVHSFACRPADDDDVRRPRRVRRALRLDRRARQRLRRAVPPREVLARRLRAAAQLRAHLRRGRRA